MGLTNAEKQARWRAKRDAEIGRLRKAAGAPSSDSPELIEARKEIERLRKENAALRAQKARPLLPTTVEEMLAAKRAVEEARKAKRTAARAAAPAEDEATLQEKLRQAEKQLAANKTRIKNLNAKLQVLSFNPPPPRMSRWLHRQIRASVHPDNARDDTAKLKLNRCSQEFNAIKFEFLDDEQA
jgi:DNA repair exonuclease SbcCD ATPase subunit